MKRKEMPKRKRTEINLQKKIEIIRHVEKGMKRSEVAAKFGIGSATVTDILNAKNVLQERYDNIGRTASLTLIRERSGELPALDESLYNWFCQARAANIPIKEESLQTKARHIAQEVLKQVPDPSTRTEEQEKFARLLEKFSASRGWLNGFKRRYFLKSFKICGEAGSVNAESVTLCQERTQINLNGFSPENIYNCDETALYWRCLPDRTLDAIGSKVTGSKGNKERLTVLLCSNSTGSDMRKPLVIGKSRNPRCFKNINPNHLGVTYRANKSAWMTGTLFA